MPFWEWALLEVRCGAGPGPLLTLEKVTPSLPPTPTPGKTAVIHSFTHISLNFPKSVVIIKTVCNTNSFYEINSPEAVTSEAHGFDRLWMCFRGYEEIKQWDSLPFGFRKQYHVLHSSSVEKHTKSPFQQPWTISPPKDNWSWAYANKRIEPSGFAAESD